jgi:Zn ribbon nucleic-acid-binding protein
MVAPLGETISLMPEGPLEHVKLLRCGYHEDKSKTRSTG